MPFYNESSYLKIGKLWVCIKGKPLKQGRFLWKPEGRVISFQGVDGKILVAIYPLSWLDLSFESDVKL